jgi:hypothetical protein
MACPSDIDLMSHSYCSSLDARPMIIHIVPLFCSTHSFRSVRYLCNPIRVTLQVNSGIMDPSIIKRCRTLISDALESSERVVSVSIRVRGTVVVQFELQFAAARSFFSVAVGPNPGFRSQCEVHGGIRVFFDPLRLSVLRFN